MPLINCKTEFFFCLGWYEECILSNDENAATFTIADAKRYVPIVTLRTEKKYKTVKIIKQRI